MQAKTQLRVVLAARRTQRAPEQLLHDEQALADRAGSLPGETIACYVGVGTEPPTMRLIDAFLVRGTRVLLPLVSAGGLHWAVGPGDLQANGPLGLLEPVGAEPAALSEADLVLVPALAVDPAGHRLGRGGGYYDRALAGVARTTRVLAVVFDDEVLDSVPFEDHDRDVDGVLTPGRLALF